MSDVLPPDASVWWDVPSVTSDVLAILRLTETDVDAARIAEYVPVVGQRINEFVDAATPVDPIPDAWYHEIVMGTVNEYRQKDSPPASSDDFGLSPGYISSDPLQPSRANLAASKRRWGIG